MEGERGADSCDCTFLLDTGHVVVLASSSHFQSLSEKIEAQKNQGSQRDHGGAGLKDLTPNLQTISQAVFVEQFAAGSRSQLLIAPVCSSCTPSAAGISPQALNSAESN